MIRYWTRYESKKAKAMNRLGTHKRHPIPHPVYNGWAMRRIFWVLSRKHTAIYREYRVRGKIFSIVKTGPDLGTLSVYLLHAIQFKCLLLLMTILNNYSHTPSYEEITTICFLGCKRFKCSNVIASPQHHLASYYLHISPFISSQKHLFQ